MKSKLIDVSFAIQDPGDTVSHIGTITYPAGTTCNDLNTTPDNNIWLEPNAYGQQRLCTTAILGTQLMGSFIGTGGPYTLPGTTFDILYPKDFHDHPIHRPR